MPQARSRLKQPILRRFSAESLPSFEQFFAFVVVRAHHAEPEQRFHRFTEHRTLSALQGSVPGKAYVRKIMLNPGQSFALFVSLNQRLQSVQPIEKITAVRSFSRFVLIRC